MKIDVMNLQGKSVSSLELPADLFGQEVRADLLQRAVKYQLASVRAGTAHTITRGEVDRTKQKWFRQKGTGRARHGARSSNIFVGGGVVFGPRGRDFSHSLPKKVRQLALKTALSSKAADKKLVVVDELKLSSAKTKDFVAALAKLNITSAAFVVDSLDSNFDRASRNVPHLKVLPTEGANVYDILAHDTLVLTPAAIELLGQRLAAEKTEKVEAKRKPSEARSAASAKEGSAKAASKSEKPAKKPAAKKPAAKAAK